MPVLHPPYHPPLIFKNGHFSTIYSALFRKVKNVQYQRERLELPDGDFMDLDWSFPEGCSGKLAILLHGLEGDSQRPYMRGMAAQMNCLGYQVLAVNFRGCSGVPNRLFRSYHAGNTEDLQSVLAHIAQKGYIDCVLIGFSLGANLALKYLGERHKHASLVSAAIAVSVPCSLRQSLDQLNRPENYLYRTKFIMQLRKKLMEKYRLFPEKFGNKAPQFSSLLAFDHLYTAPAHGFADAFDYYEKSSCARVLTAIEVPVLILNARNDSFLKGDCYPIPQAESKKNIFLLMPDYGGHVGFYDRGKVFYNEQIAGDFVKALEKNVKIEASVFKSVF